MDRAWLDTQLHYRETECQRKTFLIFVLSIKASSHTWGGGGGVGLSSRWSCHVVLRCSHVVDGCSGGIRGGRDIRECSGEVVCGCSSDI